MHALDLEAEKGDGPRDFLDRSVEGLDVVLEPIDGNFH
jgi:hypothetical protein